YPTAFDATLLDERFLCYPTPRRCTHHCRLVTDRGAARELLRFRDRLRSARALARDYEALKRRLANRHTNDRQAYTRSKTEFVRRYQ
ncbi:MAG TPA: GrpB family protein, partial [Solirubrobacteraceae bacterium]|nr:GrpB family protein [Solirubrobacteraceae bacterium]